MKRKTVKIALLITFICGLFSVSVNAENHEKIKVGYMPYRSFIEKRDDKYRGFGVDYLDEIARYQEIEYDYVKGSWDDLLVKLENNEIDLLCTAEKSEDRLHRFLFSDKEIGYVSSVLYTRSNEDDIYYEDYDSFNDLKVGIVKGSMQNQAYLAYQEEHGFNSKAILFPDFESMEKALINKEIDGIVTESLNKRNDFKLLAQFNSSPFYFMTSKENQNLMNEINASMSEIDNSNPYFQADLYYKYYGDNQISSAPPFTRKEMEYIKNSEVIRCGYILDTYPLTFDENNKASGLLVSLTKEIADISGIKFEYIPYKTYKDSFKAIQKGEIDFLLDYFDYFSINTTSIERYSDTLLELPISLISKNDYLNSTNGLRLGIVQDRFQPMETEIKHLFQTEQISYYKNYEAALNAVENNEVDFTIINSYLANSLLDKSHHDDLKTSSIKDPFPISIGYGEQVNSTTRKIINKTIPFLSKESKDSALQNLMSNNVNKDLSNYNRYMQIIVFVSIVVIALLILIYLRSSQKIRKNKIYDSLCDCFNLKTFKVKAKLALKENRLFEQYIVVMDIEHFSYVNHYYGNIVGDDVLKRFCKILKERLQPLDLLGRISKDEFVLYICEIPSSNQSVSFENIADEIVDQMALDLQLNIKIGVCYVLDSDEDVNVMIEKALMAKRNLDKGTFYKFYSPDMDKTYEIVGEIEMNKESALANKEFNVYFQPKIDLKNERIVGAEALIRWIKPDGTILPPDMFIPIFEKDSFIKKLDLYTLREVCETIQTYQFDFPISVNQSRVLLNDELYSDNLIKILENSKIDASKIEVEVTESMYIRDKERLTRVVTMLHSLNIAISIDDFGSGYSSLNLLTQLPVEIVKIDKSVLDSGGENKEILIKSIINMAHEMNMRVVCEGVESKEQRDMLARLQCDIAQGFYYSKPLKLEEFLTFIKKHNT